MTVLISGTSSVCVFFCFYGVKNIFRSDCHQNIESADSSVLLDMLIADVCARKIELPTNRKGHHEVAGRLTSESYHWCI